jgi:hypothetical protein
MMSNYSIDQIENREFRVQKFVERSSNIAYVRIDPRDIDDGPIILHLEIKDKLPFDLSRKRIERLWISDSKIDLSDPNLPRTIDTVNISNSILTGRFDLPMEVRDLRLSNVTYVRHIPAFKQFFKNVEHFSCLLSLTCISAYIPLSAKVIQVDPGFTPGQCNEILKRHPDCRAISVHVDLIENAKQFFSTYRQRLDLQSQVNLTTWAFGPRDIGPLIEYMNKLIQTDNEMFYAHWIVHGRGKDVEIKTKDGKRVKQTVDAGQHHGHIGSHIADFLRPRSFN